MQPVRLNSERERRAKVSYCAASAVPPTVPSVFGPSTKIWNVDFSLGLCNMRVSWLLQMTVSWMKFESHHTDRPINSLSPIYTFRYSSVTSCFILKLCPHVSRVAFQFLPPCDFPPSSVFPFLFPSPVLSPPHSTCTSSPHYCVYI